MPTFQIHVNNVNCGSYLEFLYQTGHRSAVGALPSEGLTKGISCLHHRRPNPYWTWYFARVCQSVEWRAIAMYSGQCVRWPVMRVACGLAVHWSDLQVHTASFLLWSDGVYGDRDNRRNKRRRFTGAKHARMAKNIYLMGAATMWWETFIIP